LTNATRHARARRISLMLEAGSDGAIELRIVDDVGRVVTLVYELKPEEEKTDEPQN